ncbi:WD repeat-containing protein 60-like isoform X3 [Anneissia japonica]|uniref:WD repeat-containing protein 60-like isoform X3 n=1 Tax=Anneissia japonica TaxID=1529436 RepID=UPI0014255EF3|nr:WD repeat-containing protein 60-like isoform X3 [Anneissia japonica]
MPSERRKKLVDTWGEDELKNSMKESRKERSKDSKSRRDGERDDRERRKRKEEKDQGSREKDRRETRDRENRREHRDDEKDDRRHREDKERRRPKEDDDERRRRKKEEERSKSGRHGNDKKKDDDDRERRKHRREEEDRDHEKDDKERRRRRRHEDDDERKDSGKRRERKHRDETEEERRKRKEKERERRHREKEAVENGSAHKDRRRSERRERDHDSDSRDRERRREDRKHREDQRKHEDNDENKHRERRRRPSDDDRDRRKQHKEEKDDSRKTGKSKEEEVINDEDLKPEKISEKQQQNLDEDEDNYDDDDFEDYDDDDFEDDNEDDESEKTPVTKSEYDELRRAMAEENEATLRRSMGGGTSSSSSSSRPTTSRTGRTFVNFVAAKQRQISDKVSQKTRKRGKELMALLDLDVVNFDLLDMAPVNEYDLYIRSFGQSNTKQAYVQCNEDNLEREIQTEEIEVDTKWTQHPADDSRGCGGEGSSKEDENNTMFKGEDSMRLARFLDKAANVISTLLEEEAAGSHHSSLQSSNLCFSRGFTNLTTNHTFLEGRDVLQVQFHPVQTNLLLTAHTLPRLDDKKAKTKSISKHPLSGCGLICLWNLNMPTKPQKVLSCQSPISCCCFSPSKTSSVFAGTEDGSVVAWDLREPSFMHSFYPVNEGKVEVQVPTYSTDGVSNEDNHHSCVVSIQPVVSITDSMQSAREEGLAFQLASMEQNGKVNFWVVMEIEKADIAGSEYDLGLVPGGKIKLMKSSFIMLKAKQRDVSHLSVSHLHFSQSDANHFYATTDAGYIMHCTRNGTADIPRLYHTKIDFPVDILAVDFHPFGLPYFLVGCRDGCIRMHHTKSEFPVITWFNSTNGMDLVSLAWSRSRPAVFFSIDVTAKMYIWDLLKGDSGPVRTEQFTHKQLTCLSLSNDHRATRTAISVREPEMALSSGKGTVEIHRLNEQFTKAEHGELSQCKEFLQTLM